MTHATPRPWTIGRYDNNERQVAIHEMGHSEGRVIAVLDDNDETDKANAALIVHAVNTLDEAKAEIREAVRRLSDLTNDLEDVEYTGGSEAVANIAYCLDTVLVKLEGSK